MPAIYVPGGRAFEYAELACNPYSGCTHGCKYCYVQNYTGKHYFDAAKPKKDFLINLKKAIAKLKIPCPEILLSFQGDPYQHIETERGLTRATISLLTEAKLPFTVLTKGGSRAIRDFDIFKEANARFGTTLVFTEQKFADEWEPNAASIEDRIKTIQAAYDAGIRTWVSLEPVISTIEALKVVEQLYPIVTHWKVGKINHNKTIENQSDWIKFRTDITNFFESVKADYELKKSLTDLK